MVLIRISPISMYHVVNKIEDLLFGFIRTGAKGFLSKIFRGTGTVLRTDF